MISIKPIIIGSVLILSLFPINSIQAAKPVPVPNSASISFLDANSNGKVDLINGTFQVNIAVDGNYWFNLRANLNSTGNQITDTDLEVNLTTGIQTVSIYLDTLAFAVANISGLVDFVFGYGSCDSNGCTIFGTDYIATTVNVDSSSFEGPHVTFVANSLTVTKTMLEGKISEYDFVGQLQSNIAKTVRVIYWISTIDTYYYLYREIDLNIPAGTTNFSIPVSSDFFWSKNYTGFHDGTFLLQEEPTSGGLIQTSSISNQFFVNMTELLTPDITIPSNPVLSQTLVDTNGDGQYENLKITTKLDVHRQTRKSTDVYFSLYSSTGGYIDSYDSYIYLNQSQIDLSEITVTSIFAGNRILRNGDIGNYSLKISIYSGYEIPETKTIAINNYNNSKFEPFHVFYNTNEQVGISAKDTTSDGLSDWVDISLPVNITQTGKYTAFAELIYNSSKFTSNDLIYSQQYNFTKGDHQMVLTIPARSLVSYDNFTFKSIGIFDYEQVDHEFLSNIPTGVYNLSSIIGKTQPINDIGTSVKAGDKFVYHSNYFARYGRESQIDTAYYVNSVANSQSNISISLPNNLPIPVIFGSSNRSLLGFYNHDYFSKQLDPSQIKINQWYNLTLLELDDFSAEYAQVQQLVNVTYNGQQITCWELNSGLFNYYYDKTTGVLLKAEAISGLFDMTLTSTNYMIQQPDNNPQNSTDSSNIVSSSTKTIDSTKTQNNFLDSNLTWLFSLVLLTYVSKNNGKRKNQNKF